MPKIYFDKQEISQHDGLSRELLELVERGMAKLERQGSFRSFYDIELVGITVYYKKNWRYEGMSQKSELGKVMP